MKQIFSALLGVLSLRANSILSRKLLGDGQVIVFVPYSGSLVQKEKIFLNAITRFKRT